MKKKFGIVLMIGIVFGIIVLVTIFGKNLFKNNIEVNKDTILEIAEQYALKQNNWNKDSDIVDGDNEYSCINLEQLIQEQKIDDSKLDYFSITNYIMVVRNDNKIISSSYVSDNICRKDEKIKVPNDICNDIIYDGESHNLINRDKSHVGYIYDNRIETDALDYSIKLSLQNYYVWDDETYEDKEVICSIKKSNINLKLSSNGTDNARNSSNEIWLNSNISGEIVVEINNPNLVNVVLDNNYIEANVDKKIIIDNIASDEVTTVKFTVVPTEGYSNNYKDTSVVYTIGKNVEKKVDIPTADSYCNKDIVFNQNVQKITKDSLEGVKFLNNQKINAGEYKITAVLDYGYEWIDGSTEDKEFICNIKKRVPEVTVEDSKVELIKDVEDYLRVDSDVSGSFEINNDNIETIGIEVNSLGYYNFNYLKLKGKNISNGNNVVIKFIPDDLKNYEEVTLNLDFDIINNEFNLVYDTKNGGLGCDISKKVYYGEEYGELCVPYKEGYEFLGWYDDSSDRINLITAENLHDNLEDITIYAHFKKDINLTLVQYDGMEIVNSEISGEIYNNDVGVKLKLPDFVNYYDNMCGEYKKLGWSISLNASKNIDYKIGQEYLFTNDLTLYANYEKEVVFKYNVSGGNEIKSRNEYIYRSASGEVTNLENWVEKVDRIPIREGYEFIGWYNNYGLEIGANALNKGKTVDIYFGCNGYELVAKWAKYN